MAKRTGLDQRLKKDRAEGLFEPTAGKVQPQKVTLYVRPDQVKTIERIQFQEWERTGKRPEKSTLVQEALDLLAAKYGVHSNTSSR